MNADDTFAPLPSTVTNQIHQEAARYADQRAAEMTEYLRGNDRTKQRLVNKWLDEENAKPRTTAYITGLERTPEL